MAELVSCFKTTKPEKDEGGTPPSPPPLPNTGKNQFCPCSSRSESKHWVHVKGGKGRLTAIDGGGLESSFQTDTPRLTTGYPLSGAILGASAGYIDLRGCCTCAQLQIIAVHGRVDWWRPARAWLLFRIFLLEGRDARERIKSNPKTRRLTSVVREMGSCRSQR